MKKLYIILISLFLIFLLVAPASAWYQGYGARNNITITPGSSGSVQNYTLLVKLSTSSGTDSNGIIYVNKSVLSNYNDVKFTTTGDVLLNHWIENYNSTAARMWVNIPNLVASTPTTVFMYFNNSSAASTSNSSFTWRIFDDFDGATLNSTKWTSSGSITIVANSANISASALIRTPTSMFDDSVPTIVVLNATRKANNWYGFGTEYTLFNSTISTNYYNWFSSSTLYAVTDGTPSNSTYRRMYQSRTSEYSGIWRYYTAFSTDTLDDTVTTEQRDSRTTDYQMYTGTGTTASVGWVAIGNTSFETPTFSYLYVYPAYANFTANVTSGKSPLVVLFTSSSTGSPAGYNWSFGDGNTSTSASPTNTFYKGSYNISLTVIKYGTNNTLTRLFYINVNQTPVASFTSNVTTGSVPLGVGFNDTSLYSPIWWNWSFGDGTYNSSANCTKLYSTRGNYTVTLNASSPDGSSYSTSYITVTTASNTSTGSGVQYPPHNVIITLRDQSGAPVPGVSVSMTPLGTTMGSIDWLYTWLGIDYNKVNVDTAVMTGTTGSDGTVSFMVISQIQYSISMSKSGMTPKTEILYPNNDAYMFTVYTVSLPATPVPMGQVITFDLDAYQPNDTYAFLNMSWLDTGSPTATYGCWTVRSGSTVVAASVLSFTNGNTSASYATSLTNSDETYTYGYSIYHPTYGWFNQSKVIQSHKKVNFIPTAWKPFVSFGIMAFFGTMFSRRSWKHGLFAMSAIGMGLAQVGIVEIGGSLINTMIILGVIMALSILTLLRSKGDEP